MVLMENVFSKIGQTVGMTLAPQTYLSVKQQRENQNRKNAFAEAGKAFQAGNYKDAAAPMFEMGDLQTGMQIMQHGQTQEQEKLRRTYEGVKLISQQTDFNSRLQMAQALSSELGLPAVTDPNDLSDAELAKDLELMRVQGGFQEDQGEAYTLAPGAVRLDGMNQVVASNPKVAAPQSTFSVMTPEQEIEHFGSDMPGSYQIESGTNKVSPVSGTAPRAPLVTNTIGGNEEPSIFEERLDAAAADEYIAWTQGGGADAVKQLSQVGEVMNRLQSGEEDLTGPLLGMVSPQFRALFNQGSVDAQQLVEEVVQRNLRLILGAQFTEKEGKMLIDRAYNPQLDEAVNARRLSRLFTQMSTAAQQKQAQMQYLEQNRTLRGFRGTTPGMSDFFAALEEEDGGANSPNWSPDQEKRLQELEAKAAAGNL